MTRHSEQDPPAPDTHPLQAGKGTIAPLILAALASAAVIAFAHRAGFLGSFVINDDARQQLYWMQRWIDPGLYPPSLLNDYAEAYVPWGVKALYRVCALFTDPLRASLWISGALFVAQCVLLGLLAARVAGRRAFAAGVAMGWLMPFFLENISGGLSRGFASPLLAGFCLSMLSGGRGMAFTLAAQALFIPYIFMPCALAVLLRKGYALASGSGPVWPDGRKAWVALACCAAAVGAFSLAYSAKGFGPLVSLAETAGRPEFGPQGRLDLVPLPHPFLDFVYYPFERIGMFKEWGLAGGIASLVLLAPALWLGGRGVNWRGLARSLSPLGWTALAFLAFYVVSRALAFKLFVPDRYVQYPVNLLYALLLAACAASAVARLGRGPRLGAALLALALLLGALRLSGVSLYDYSAQAPLYAAVEAATPKDAVIAGHPETMDNVMTFAHRNAYATFELAHPWSRGYWVEFEKRLDAFFAAYYARDEAAVIDFARRSGVDFLLVEPDRLAPAALSKSAFFEPFGSRIRQLTQAGGGFAVLGGGGFTRVELPQGAFLIDLRPLKATGEGS